MIYAVYMADSDEAPATEETAATTKRRRVSPFNRRPRRLTWLTALVAFVLLLAAISYGLHHRGPSSAHTPTVPTPTRTLPPPTPPKASVVPPITLAPAAVLRSGNTVTLSGDFPDDKAKAALVDAVTGALPPGVNVIEQLGINPDINALDFSDGGPVFKAAASIGDFRLTVKGDTITLAGTAATSDQLDAVEQAAEDAWPELNISDTMSVSGPVTLPQPPNTSPATPSPSAATTPR